MEQTPMDQSVVFAFGRFNPPTIGHGRLVDALRKEAASQGVEPRIVLTRSHDSKKNPLSPEQKLHWVETFFPDTSVELAKPGEGITQYVDSMLQDGTEFTDNVTLVVGGDRVDEFTKLLSPLGVKVVSAGYRDDSDGLAGVSASKMRDAVATDDVEAFIKMCPDNISDENLAEFFVQIKNGLSVPPKDTPKITIGECVRTVMGDLLEVVDLRTNYLIGINESGEMNKWFMDQVRYTTESIQWPAGTVKGHIVTENEDLLNRLCEIDTYGVLKYISCLQENLLDEAEIRLEKLYELVSTQTQNSAIDVIANTFDVKPVTSSDPKKKLGDLQKKMKNKPLNKDKKDLYNKMLNSLGSLDIPVQLDNDALDQ